MGLKVRDTFLDFEGANPSGNADFKGRTKKDTSQIIVNSVNNSLIINSVISTIPNITGSLSQIKNLTKPSNAFFNGEAIKSLHLGESSPDIIEHQHNEVPLQINYDFGEQCLINHFKINSPPLYPIFDDVAYTTYHSFARKIEFSGSNDNSNYTPLTELNNDFLGTYADISLQNMSKTFPNNNQFRFYRFKISEYGPHPDIVDTFINQSNFITGSFFITEIEFENKEPSNKINTNAILFSNFDSPLISLHNGWNMIGYNLPLPPTDFYESMAALMQTPNYQTRMTIIKNVDGQFHAPSTGGIHVGFTTFVPTEAYMIYCINLPGESLTTRFPLELMNFNESDVSLSDFNTLTEYKSFANANHSLQLNEGWNMVSYPRYTRNDDTLKALYAAFVDKPPGSITYDKDLDIYLLNNQEVDIYSLPLRNGATHLNQLMKIFKNNLGQFASPENNYFNMPLVPGQGYQLYALQSVTINFAGDQVISSLPFIDTQ